MMEVDGLTFEFPENWIAEKYDEWDFYKKTYKNAFFGQKGVDIIARDADRTLWFIEAKDYRLHKRTKTIELAEEVALKVRDTLSGLTAAAVMAESKERKKANNFFSCRRMRIVLQIMQPAVHSKLFPQVIDPSKVQQKLKSIVKSIDAHPKVTDKKQYFWTIT